MTPEVPRSRRWTGKSLPGVVRFDELGEAAEAGFGERYDSLGFVDGDIVVRLEKDPDVGPRRSFGHFFLNGFFPSLWGLRLLLLRFRDEVGQRLHAQDGFQGLAGVVDPVEGDVGVGEIEKVETDAGAVLDGFEEMFERFLLAAAGDAWDLVVDAAEDAVRAAAVVGRVDRENAAHLLL